MSEQHIALPLKYRPMTFEDVVGQAHVVRTLRHAIESNRVANAYLFIGPRGIGKTTMSRIFAKALNCLEPDGVEPCGKCINCEEIAQGRSLDVTELDAASHNKVEDVRPIIESVQFKPANSKYRIYIIDECHMLTNAAWNALLKTLEEPPPWVRFIFATTEGDKVLATIISRCQRFDLRRIQTNDIVSRLEYICGKEGVDAERDALLAIARGAEGGMRDALSSLDQLVSFKGNKVTEEDALGVFGLVSRSALEGLAGAILAGDTAAILEAIEKFDSAGKNMRSLTGELLRHFRNLLVLKSLGPDSKSLEATEDQIETLKRQSAGVDAGRIFRICDLLGETDEKLRHVLSVRTLIEMSLIKAGRIASTATIEELMRAVKSLKEGGVASAPVSAANLPRTESPKITEPAPEPRRPVTMRRELPLPTMPAAVATPAPASRPAESKAAPAASAPASATLSERIEDPKLNEILSSVKGARIVDFKEARK